MSKSNPSKPVIVGIGTVRGGVATTTFWKDMQRIWLQQVGRPHSTDGLEIAFINANLNP